MIRYLIPALFLIGCGEESHIEQSTAKFNEMCSRTELYICNDNIEKLHYNNATEEEIALSAQYEYMLDMDQYDIKDYYNYMHPHDDGILRGDCEDFAITMAEDNIVMGNIDVGELKMMVGAVDGGGHIWLLITKGNEEYLFDNYYWYGVQKDIAYDKYDYIEDGVIYEY